MLRPSKSPQPPKPPKNTTAMSIRTPDGYIRSGHRRVSTRCTRGEIVARLEDLIKVMWKARWTHRSQLIYYLIKKYPISPSQAVRYIKAAHERLLMHLREERENHRANSLAFYESVIRDSKASFADRLKARERIDKLLGLESPHTVHVSGIPFNKTVVSVASLNLDLETRKRLLEAVRVQQDRVLPERTETIDTLPHMVAEDSPPRTEA